MRLLVSFAALFLSVILLQLSSGAVGPLDVLSGLQLNFAPTEIGLLGSAHFLGFFIGCWLAPRFLGNVGYSRAFSAFTAAGAIGLLGHMMVLDPLAWALFRMATGICIAGCYTVVEAWLQGKVTNETRGRAMGAYRFVDLAASLAAQMFISVLEPANYVSYNLLAILCCASLIPLALTKATAPAVPSAPRLRPQLAFLCSPLAAAAVVVAGLTGASFRMVGPLYGQEVGLTVEQLALFLAAFVAGGAVAQYPMGWLADKYDRRWILIALSALAILSSGFSVSSAYFGSNAVLFSAMIFGFITFPIYSVAAAHAHDFANSDQRVELSAALMFLFALGAILSPLSATYLIDRFGPNALFVFVAIGHFVLVFFGLARMRSRPTQSQRVQYIYVPRTSFTIGRLLKRRRDNQGPKPPDASGG